MLEYFTVKASEINLSNRKMLLEFSKERRKKIEVMKNEAAKKLCAAAELALIKTVKHFYPNDSLPIEYRRSEHGKPYLCNHTALHINISHSGNYAVCAASDCPIGVDLQQIRKVNFNICKKYFTSDEQLYVGCDEQRFFEIWSKKESRVKATGTGITIPLNSFSVLDNNDTFKFIELIPPESGYVMYVCEKRSVPKLK